MAFPSNPSNGDTYLRYGRTYEYDSAMSMWKVKKSSIAINDLDDVDLTTIAPQTGDYLQYDGTSFVPFNTAKLISYATVSQLPLVNVTNGQMAYVQDLGRLYIWNGNGWFSVALVNTAPTITTGPDASYVFATDGTPIVLTLEAQDPEGIPITWSYQVTSGVLGSTATIVQDGNVFTITPSTSDTDAGEFSITFTASDGVNLATAATSFTLKFGVADAYYNLNSLLIKTGSTAGLTNSSFVDSSSNQVTITTVGNAYQGSYSPFSPAGWSGYFDGNGDYLTMPDNAQLTIGTNFTAEMWFYWTGVSTGSMGLMAQHKIGGRSWLLYLTPSGVGVDLGGVGGILKSADFKNQWVHIAWVKQGTTNTFYVNGVSAGTATGTPASSTDVLIIGANNDSSSPVWFFDGYISDIRITNTAVYTSNFIPPTEKLTAITGTILLTLQDNRIVDNSTNNFAITRYGNINPVPNSPYLPLEQYDPAVHGGSIMNDGVNGSYISAPVSFDRRNNNWTFEGWYWHSTITGTCLCSSGSSFYIQMSTTQLYVGDGATNPINTAHGLIAGQWNHIAVSYDGTTIKAFINGELKQTTVNKLAAGTISTLYIGRRDATYYMRDGDKLSDFRYVADAVYTDTFTPPTVPLSEITGTQLLLKMANAGIYDEMSKSNFSLIGNATTSTTVTKYNTTSMYFDGTGDYVLINNPPAFGTSDFTVDCWVNIENLTGDKQIIDWRPTSTNGAYVNLGISGASVALYVNAVTQIQTGQILTANTWHHIALVRNNGTSTIYVDGTPGGTWSDSTNYIASTVALIGVRGWDRAGSFFLGYIEDFRITNGHARYPLNQTPTQALTQIPNTQLLLNGSSSGIVDSTGKTIGVYGNTTSSTTQTKYNGYSMYFDGVGDYIGVSDSSLAAAGDFTIETWFFMPALIDSVLFHWSDFTGTSFDNDLITLLDGGFKLRIGSGGNTFTLSPTGLIKPNTWHHVALTRSSTDVKLYFDGYLVHNSTATSAVMDSEIEIGRNPYGGGVAYFSGYMSDFRIVVGNGNVYTPNFAPPTAALGFDNAE